MFDHVTREDWIDAALMCGLILFGFAAGTQVSLHLVTEAVVTTRFIPLETQAGVVFPAMKVMQTLTNVTATVGGALLVAGMAAAQPDAVRSLWRELREGETDD